MKRLRWWIAGQLNRLPGQCWASLVTWALGWHKRGGNLEWKPLPWSPVTATCRLDCELNGACWCGKLRTERARDGRPA